MKSNIFIDPTVYRQVVAFRLRKYLHVTGDELSKMSDKEASRLYLMLMAEEGKKCR